MKKSIITNSSSLKADAWHHRSDAITSVAAFVGISIALFLGKGYESADDWAALFASIFILYNSYQIFRPALGEIMDEHRYDDLVENIRTRIPKSRRNYRHRKMLHPKSRNEISRRFTCDCRCKYFRKRRTRFST